MSRLSGARGLGNVGDMHVAHHEKSGRYYMFYLDRSGDPVGLFRAESPNETDFDFEHAVGIAIGGETGAYRCPHVLICDDLWHMFYGFKHEERAGYATSSDGLHWVSRNTKLIDGHDPEILPLDDDMHLLFYCPSEYHMGHEPGSDIRVAIFNGRLSDLGQGSFDSSGSLTGGPLPAT